MFHYARFLGHQDHHPKKKNKERKSEFVYEKNLTVDWNDIK